MLLITRRPRPHFLSLHPGTLDIPLPVQHDQIRIRARPERALLVLNPKTFGGVVRSALDCLTKRAASEASEVSHTFLEGYDAARKGVGTFEVKLIAFFDKPLAVTPLMDAVFEVGIENLHG